jgi:hypothetical protein
VIALPIVLAQIAVLSSTVEERTASAGERYTATIVVSNPTGREQVARIYQTDYRFSADGTSHFDDPGTSVRSNAPWITLQTTRVVLPPGAEVRVPYSVEIPGVDSLRGTYWSAIMVEGQPSESVTRPEAANGAATVAVGAIVRYAVQVATHLQATGTRSVRFDGAAASKSDYGNTVLDLDVTNAGERGYRPVMWIEVYDEAGTLRATAKQSRGLLFPGTSLHQHFDLGSLAAGRYKAVVFADTGEETVYAKQFTIAY